MSEQAPENPEQFHWKVRSLYDGHKANASSLEGSSEDTERAVAKVAEAEEILADAQKTNNGGYIDKWRAIRDERADELEKAKLDKEADTKRYDQNLEEATEHYRDNEAAYHKLAMVESPVDIKVQQPEMSPEPIEVHTSDH